MGFESIIDIIGVVAKFWTPEKIRGRARLKINKLKEEESAILKKPATAKSAARLLVIRDSVKRLSEYLAQ